jgi:acyl carrier protein
MEEKFIEQLKEILEIDDRKINLEDEFRSYPEWDSMAALSVIAMIDEEFGVVLNTETFGKLRTIADLIEEIKKKMS